LNSGRLRKPPLPLLRLLLERTNPPL